jgi:hypothetical protein
MTMKTIIKTKQIPLDAQLIAGLTKHFPKGATIVIAGKKVPIAEIVARLKARIDAVAAVAPARAGWREKVRAQNATLDETEALISAVRRALTLMFDQSVDTLADFGLAMPKPRRALTSEERVLAVQRAKATREARHTMGRKQRRGITGADSAPAPTAASPPPALNGASNGAPA